MKTVQLSRRGFLKSGATASMGAGLALSGMAPSFAAPQSPTLPVKVHRRKKALVFIMLDGGNDSFNMLVPRSASHYAQYAKTRSNLALEKETLLPLNGTDAQGQQFGIHPAMPEAQQLFNQKKLAFVANVGPMIEPVHQLAFYSQSARLPLGLMSHADQFKHWQTARPELRSNRGWLGAIADGVQMARAETQVPMNISLAGNNIMQNGQVGSPYAINQQGSVGLVVNEHKNDLNTELLQSFEALLNTNYEDDPFKQGFISETRKAQRLHRRYHEATENVDVDSPFSDSQLSQELKTVAQSIHAADALNLDQQTFFIRYIGWDHHDELLSNHQRMLGVLSQGLGEFQSALE